MLHIGHIETLKKARELGDYLIVGLHDDEVFYLYNSFNFIIFLLDCSRTERYQLSYFDPLRKSS